MATKGVKHSFGIKGAGAGAKTEQGRGRVSPPPDGTYAATLLQLKLGDNSNGDPMLTAIFQLKITNPKLKKHDGFWVWHRFNITEQGTEYINGFLNCLAGDERKGLALQKIFWGEGGVTVADDKDPSDVLNFGNFRINSPKGTRPIVVTIEEDVFVDKKNNEVVTARITKFAPAGASLDEADDVADDDDADVEDTDENFDEEDDQDTDVPEEDDDDDLGDDDPEDETAGLEAELKGLDLRALRLKARDEYEIAAADTKGKTEAEVIDMILEAAAASDEDGDDGLDDDDLGEDEPEEKPAPARRRAKGKAAPPF